MTLSQMKSLIDEGKIGIYDPRYMSHSKCCICSKQDTLYRCFTEKETYKCYLVCEDCTQELFQIK